MCQSRVTLADCPGLGSIRLCSCGCIQLTLGPVTVRLQPEALAQTSVLLQMAEHKYARLEREQQTGSQADDWQPNTHLLH